MFCGVLAEAHKPVGAIHESPEIKIFYQNKLVYALYNSVAINLCKHIPRGRAIRESPLQRMVRTITLNINLPPRRRGAPAGAGKRLRHSRNIIGANTPVALRKSAAKHLDFLFCTSLYFQIIGV